MDRYGKEHREAREIMGDTPKVCVNCGSTDKVEVHHIVPLSMGGSNRASNIVYLCLECHYRAHGAQIGRYAGQRKGRPRMEKPLGADVLIERYIRAEITGVQAYRELGIKRGHKFADVTFVREYFDEHGIREVRRNWGGSKNLTTTVFYKDGRVEDYRNGELIGSN